MNASLADDWKPEAVDGLAALDVGGLPKSLLYATSSGLGGTGLNTTSLEGVTASVEKGFLKRVLFFENDQKRVPECCLRSLNWHPVRALSHLESQRYYSAKKRYVSWIAERELKAGGYDFFHGWSGDCFRALIEARKQGVPCVMDIPTWHRNKGKAKSGETRTEREIRLGKKRSWLEQLEISRLEMLAEYDLADVILVPSKKSAETFLAAGVSEDKLHYVARGVDVERYRPGPVPEVFRVCFVGALIERKGVHLLLEAWKKLGLKDAELVLVGTVHEEMKRHLSDWSTGTVKLTGFTSSVQDELRNSAVFVFPSECEGFAKSTLEAAACGLPLIATEESGDAVLDGETGMVIPAGDVDALADALKWGSENRVALAEMGRKGRERVERFLTWDHYRMRLLHGYKKAMGGRG